MTNDKFSRDATLSDEAEAFIRHEWLLLGDDQGEAMAVTQPIAITAREDGAIVGVVKGWCSGGIGYISELMVAHDRRGSGLGAQLLREAEALCREVGARWMALRVEADSRAVGFYEREGWTREFTVSDWLNGHDYLQLRKRL